MSQLCRVNQDPVEISGLLGVIEMKGLTPGVGVTAAFLTIYFIWVTIYPTALKVPKREIFVTELFILCDPIWVGDLRNEPKKPFV
jgi:hypothetical protein